MPAAPGYTLVSSAHLRDAAGFLITNATATFTPSQAFLVGVTGGATVSSPVTTPVVNGALLTQLADTSISNPTNVSYSLVVTDNLSGRVLLQAGYNMLQPSGASWSLDTYRPYTPALGLIAQGPIGPAGPTGPPFGSGTITTVTSLMGTGFVPCNLDTGGGYLGVSPTDCTSVLNTFLATATAAAPIHLIVDVGCLISGTLITASSNVTIEGLGWSTGFYLADGAGATHNMIQNGTGAGLSGTFSPLPALGSNFALRNLRLNGNRKYYTGTDGTGHYTQGLVLANLRGVRVENVWFYDICTYAAMFTNCTDVVCFGSRVDSPSNAGNTDGLHFNGNCFDLRIDSCYFNSGDDSIALNSCELAPGPISRIAITNCTFYNCTTMVRAYTENGGVTGTVSGVVVDNCVATLLKDTANFINCGFLLGFNDISSGKAVDSITDFSASNCTITSSCPVCIIGDPSGSVKLRNITWNAHANNCPAVSTIGNGPVSYLETEIRCYRIAAPDSTGGPYLLAAAYNGAFATSIGSGAPGGIGTVQNQFGKVRIVGWEVIDQYAQSFANAAYLIDMTYLSIGELVIDSINTEKTTAFLNPFTGTTGLSKVAGRALLEMGFPLASSLVANNYPYIDSVSGVPAINLAGTKKTFTLT